MQSKDNPTPGSPEAVARGTVGTAMPQAVTPPLEPPFPVVQTREFRLNLFMPAGDLTPFAELRSNPLEPAPVGAMLNPTIDYRSASLEPAGYRAVEVQHLQPTYVVNANPWNYINPWPTGTIENPEPGTLVLLGCGLAALAWRVRRFLR